MKILIRLYQWGVSPLLLPSCRFYPSCSAYAYDAFTAHSFYKALILTGRRLLKCHPFHGGGYDPVPPAKGLKETLHI